ncbi:MAG: DUF790 family protein [Myxococcales bacterium]|nr:DUF790 family protein [Myxococcales bacterium]
MLQTDHVRAFRKKDELHLRSFDKKLAARAEEIAGQYLEIVRHAVGDERQDVMAALDGVDLEAREQKLADGLKKLVLDRTEFESETALDPVALREEVFTAAALARMEGDFQRETLLETVAEKHGVPPEELERLLYADLKQAHRLLSFVDCEPSAIVREYELGQVQAVLLKAERVTASVRCVDPAGYRHLFRALKFHRLLHRIAKIPEGGYLVEIDGPASLFSSTTKYGLQLALVLPALRACDAWALDAEVRWGKDRTRLHFRADGHANGAREELALPEELSQLLERLRETSDKHGWSVEVADAIFTVPGLGELVPDLRLSKGKREVFVEVLGHWSRDAVWKRVEASERGLPAPFVFCCSSRLRVSEDVLPDDVPAALYVYKGVMSAKQILDRVKAVA